MMSSECMWTKASRRMAFILGTSPACVQNESCTDANDRPTSSHLSAESIMWVASSEWMKFGGKPAICLRLRTVTDATGAFMAIDWRRVVMTRCWGLRYGWTTGSLRGVVQTTADWREIDFTPFLCDCSLMDLPCKTALAFSICSGETEDEIIPAHWASHSWIFVAPANIL